MCLSKSAKGGSGRWQREGSSAQLHNQRVHTRFTGSASVQDWCTTQCIICGPTWDEAASLGFVLGLFGAFLGHFVLREGSCTAVCLAAPQQVVLPEGKTLLRRGHGSQTRETKVYPAFCGVSSLHFFWCSGQGKGGPGVFVRAATDHLSAALRTDLQAPAAIGPALCAFAEQKAFFQPLAAKCQGRGSTGQGTRMHDMGADSHTAPAVRRA